MSGAVLNSRFLTRLLTSGEEDIEHVSMLKESISSTTYELTMLTLSISVTFNVTCLTGAGYACSYAICTAELLKGAEKPISEALHKVITNVWSTGRVPAIQSVY